MSTFLVFLDFFHFIFSFFPLLTIEAVACSGTYHRSVGRVLIESTSKKETQGSCLILNGKSGNGERNVCILISGNAMFWWWIIFYENIEYQKSCWAFWGLIGSIVFSLHFIAKAYHDRLHRPIQSAIPPTLWNHDTFFFSTINSMLGITFSSFSKQFDAFNLPKMLISCYIVHSFCTNNWRS